MLHLFSVESLSIINAPNFRETFQIWLLKERLQVYGWGTVLHQPHPSLKED